MPEQVINARFDGRAVWNVGPGLSREVYELANSYYCPLGIEPGVAWLLMLRADAAAIMQGGYTPRALEIKAGAGVLRCSALWPVSAVCVDNTRAMYLVKAVDKRHHARWGVLDTHYNVRCPAPPATSGATLAYESSLNSGSVWTWQTMVTDITGSIPDWSGSATLPYTPDGTPEGFVFRGVPALEALAGVLERISCALSYDPADDAFSIVQTGTEQAGLASLLTASTLYLMDADPFETLGAMGAETLAVMFQRRDLNYGTERATPQSTGGWIDTPVYRVDAPTGIVGARAGTVDVVYDDLPALYAFDGTTVINTSALTTRAGERADQYAAQVNVSDRRRRTLYQGIVPGFRPGSQVKAVCWRNYGDGWLTELLNHPGKAMPAPGAARAVAGGLIRAIESLSSPDIARAMHPLYPCPYQLVQVAGSSGALATPYASSGLFDGNLLRADATGTWTGSGVYATHEAVWLAIVNPFSGSQQTTANLFGGDRFLAKLNGSATVTGITRPLYLLQRPESQVYALVAGSTVAEGGSLAFTLLDGRSGNATCQTDITTGDKCLLWWDFNLKIWLVASLGGGSGTPLFRGVLSDNLSAGDASGEAILLTSLTSGEADVAGPVNFFNYVAQVGRIGYDAYFAKNLDGYYELLAVERAQEYLECEVYSAFDKDTPSFSARVIRSYTGWREPGEVITVQNQVDPTDPDHGYVFEGEMFAVCQVQYDELEGVWRVVWVECPETSPVATEGLAAAGNQNQLFQMLTGPTAGPSGFF